MKIALVQQHASPDGDDNRRRGLEAVDRAADLGARRVVFAELAFERFLPQVPATSEALALAEPVPGPTTEAFAARARARGVVIVLNVFERVGDRTHDCSPVIDADGRLLGATLCNRVGEEPRLTFAGESLVCDPSGRVIARAGRGTDEILTCDVDLDLIERSHARRLLLRDRRPELYAAWLANPGARSTSPAPPGK